MQHRRHILHFDDINRCHEFMGFTGRTDLPDFHVYTVEETYPSTRKVMPPYTLRFYCVLLLEDNSHDALIELNLKRLEGPSNTVSFQSPGHVSAWIRGEAQRGFILYFQPEFLSRYSTSILEDFPFFHPTEINVLALPPREKEVLRAHFVRLVQVFKTPHRYRVPMLQTQLLTFLFDCKGLYEEFSAKQVRSNTKQSIATQFQQLLEQHFLTHQSVQAYAALLNVTPNHLSQVVSSTLGRQAHDIIAERILLEAKKLLRYTDLSIAEIANYLGFDEPTHFGRFFKQRLALTPLHYRHAILSEEAQLTKP